MAQSNNFINWTDIEDLTDLFRSVSQKMPVEASKSLIAAIALYPKFEALTAAVNRLAKAVEEHK